MYDFNFTTFVRQILFVSIHYISIKVLKVESCYYVAALKVSGWFLLLTFFNRDTFSDLWRVGRGREPWERSEAGGVNDNERHLRHSPVSSPTEELRKE